MESGGSSVTTANMAAFMLTWRGPAVLILGFALVCVFIASEIFAGIHMCADILDGGACVSSRQCAGACGQCCAFCVRAAFLCWHISSSPCRCAE
ncbi:MAG: hypothetical protein IJP86_06065 [Synergistaceae bacterium]|nr:hypothetical protein [Synergistaceae bacterium]